MMGPRLARIGEMDDATSRNGLVSGRGATFVLIGVVEAMPQTNHW